MPEILIAGIPINFPFEPYDVQRRFMEKVINCLQDGTNGILESPTGTGKTLSLLCSSLAWLLSRKEGRQGNLSETLPISDVINERSGLSKEIGISKEANERKWCTSKIIYASRTHSQLTQAMQELKKTAYSFMRAVVLGSRDQLCIHPEVMREPNNYNKLYMCKSRVQTRQCSFYTRVETRKNDPQFQGATIMDIEDLTIVGQKLKMCPYYSSKELVSDADIIFMPYNYLLDPTVRKANKVELTNAVIILDEAHNIEKICEESASVQFRSSDVAMAIDDITYIMKTINKSEIDTQEFDNESKDFTLDELVLLKEMLLELEKSIDEIVINKLEGTTFPAAYMFELLHKANVNYDSKNTIITLLDKLIQYLAVESHANMTYRGGSLQKFVDLLNVVFINKKETVEKIYESFKVHIEIEETKASTFGKKTDESETWLGKSINTTKPKIAKVINYWCFNPGFGMKQLLNKNVRSILLTSGTLAPLKPFIAELALPVSHQLENPHIIPKSQVFVKIIGIGPDREPLISNFQNRENVKYINSLGCTILNVARIVPDGLLVFFPSYTLLNKCVNVWKSSAVWSDISQFKSIFVESRLKEDFTNTMECYYESIKNLKGACFMAVCRGKVSEGLDFSDRNGRAVVITGLPFPPLKDAKVILKRQYLDESKSKHNELLSGQAWYALEAIRAVNQAIGRVIRHRDDYGAILFCDIRFQQSSQIQQLSKWIRDILGHQIKNLTFGNLVKELREFYKNIPKTLPEPKDRSIVKKYKMNNCESLRGENSLDSKEILFQQNKKNYNRNFINIEDNDISNNEIDYTSAILKNSQLPSELDFFNRLNDNVSTIDFNYICNNSKSFSSRTKSNKNEKEKSSSRITISNHTNSNQNSTIKKKKYRIAKTDSFQNSGSLSLLNMIDSDCNLVKQMENEQLKKNPESRVEFLKLLRGALKPKDFSDFTAAIVSYKNDDTIEDLMNLLFRILFKPDLLSMLRGMKRFLKPKHREIFEKRLKFEIESSSLEKCL